MYFASQSEIKHDRSSQVGGRAPGIPRRGVRPMFRHSCISDPKIVVAKGGEVYGETYSISTAVWAYSTKNLRRKPLAVWPSRSLSKSWVLAKDAKSIEQRHSSLQETALISPFCLSCRNRKLRSRLFLDHK